MNHLPLLLAVLIVVGIGVYWVGGGREDEDETERTPPLPPDAAAPPPDASSPPAPTPDAESANRDEEPEELEPPPEELGPDGRKVDLSLRLEAFVADDVSVSEALEQLGRRLGCDVSFSDDAWTRVGSSSSASFELSDVYVTTVLHVLTEPYGLVYQVRAGVLWILGEGEEPPEAAR